MGPQALPGLGIVQAQPILFDHQVQTQGCAGQTRSDHRGIFATLYAKAAQLGRQAAVERIEKKILGHAQVGVNDPLVAQILHFGVAGSQLKHDIWGLFLDIQVVDTSALLFDPVDDKDIGADCLTLTLGVAKVEEDIASHIDARVGAEIFLQTVQQLDHLAAMHVGFGHGFAIRFRQIFRLRD